MNPDEDLLPSVEAMAEEYLRLIEPDDEAPLVLAGLSYGGLVAHEMGRLLARAGHRAVSVVLLDTQATDDASARAEIGAVDAAEFRDKLVRFNGMYPGIDDAQVDRYFHLYNHNRLTAREHLPATSPARIVLARAVPDGDDTPSMPRSVPSGSVAPRATTASSRWNATTGRSWRASERLRSDPCSPPNSPTTVPSWRRRRGRRDGPPSHPQSHPGRYEVRLLAEAVLGQARRTPAAVAVEDGNRVLDYAELELASGRVATWLHAAGVRPGHAVAVHLPRSWQLVCVMLGIRRAGATVVPSTDSARPTGNGTSSTTRAPWRSYTKAGRHLNCPSM